MNEHFDLGQVHTTLELHNYLLRVDAEALTVPACQIAWVPRIGCQLADSVCSVLARTMENLEVQKGVSCGLLSLRARHGKLCFLLILLLCIDVCHDYLFIN